MAAILVSSETENAVANGDTRTLSLYHVHTHETASITFRVNGVYDSAALEKLNWMLRDWRRNEPTKMDPRLFDVMWEVYHESGSQQPIWIMCGYRSPETNAMLRRRSRAVAEYSQHMLGKAMDVHFADLSMQKIRDIAMRLQSGGVGYYPTSGTPFVHIDVGGVRYWPRMSYEEMARIFPDGKTVDIPANGRPMPGYDLALADIKARGGEAFSASASSSGGGLLAALFGHGEDTDSAPSMREDRGRSTQVADNTTTANDASPQPAAERPDRGQALRWSAAPIATDTAPPPAPAETEAVAAAEPAVPLPTPRPADLVAETESAAPTPPERPNEFALADPVPDPKTPAPVATAAPAAPAPRTTVVAATMPRLLVSAQPDGAETEAVSTASVHMASADDSMPLLMPSHAKQIPLPSVITQGTSSSKAEADASVLAFAPAATEDSILTPRAARPFKPHVTATATPPIKKMLMREHGEFLAARIDRSNFHVLTGSAPMAQAIDLGATLGAGSSVMPLRAGLRHTVESVMFSAMPMMMVKFRQDAETILAGDHFEGAAIHFLSEADGIEVQTEIQVSDAGQ